MLKPKPWIKITAGRLFSPEISKDVPLEEFGFIGGISLLGLYFLLIIFCGLVALACRDRYSGLVVSGITMTFFLYFAVNMAMVMGLAPVVGVPLPLVSYGGSAMFVLMIAFGIIQSADIHRAR